MRIFTGRRIAAGLLIGGLLSGCSSLSPDADSAGAAAVAFSDAVQSGDGSGACDLLAPETARQVAETGGDSCEASILTEDLPALQSVVEADAVGSAAEVKFDDDVVFLALFGGTWKVTAAGCTARADQPYDCTVSGG